MPSPRLRLSVPGPCLPGLLLALALVSVCCAQKVAPPPAADPALQGRWDLVVKGPAGEYPSWLEIDKSGTSTLVGSYVGQFGSARPISEVQVEGDGRSFVIVVPPQWEKRETDVTIRGRLDGETLSGEVTGDNGERLAWTARRAPALDRKPPVAWGAPIELFNGRDLGGWKARTPGKPNGWKVVDGVLVNAEPGNDLVSERKFEDFKLVAEFRYPPGSNSGIYLRGRYEVQIEDNAGREADSHLFGGVYGFLTPRINAARPAGEWQTAEITLVGRRISVSLNGEQVIDRQIIPGPTGGALDSDEGTPGPIMLQGDHGVVEFRKLVVMPGG
ncbi:MAG: DUF1080 domain-containing protein [Pirellulales bacterium]